MAKLTERQERLRDAVLAKPGGTCRRYGVHKRKLEELVRLGALRKIKPKRWGMPTRYAGRAER